MGRGRGYTNMGEWRTHGCVQVLHTYALPVCHWNPGNFTCRTCKGFKHVGICSHVLATDHMLELINLNYLMATLCKPASSQGRREGKLRSHAQPFSVRLTLQSAPHTTL